jgi:hypothetical protein
LGGEVVGAGKAAQEEEASVCTYVDAEVPAAPSKNALKLQTPYLWSLMSISLFYTE